MSEPDFANPNREPVLSVMDLARLSDEEMVEGYTDGAEGLPCGGNRSRSYWHGWRQGAGDNGHRQLDRWDREFTRLIASQGRLIDLPRRIAACRLVLRDMGELP